MLALLVPLRNKLGSTSTDLSRVITVISVEKLINLVIYLEVNFTCITKDVGNKDFAVISQALAAYWSVLEYCLALITR